MSVADVLAAIAAVLVLAFAIWRRDRLGLERKLVAAAVVIGLGLYASGVLDGLPSVDEMIEDVSATLGVWTYPIVTLLAFLETAAFVGLIVPGDTIVIAGGVVAGQGEINIVFLIGLVWTAVVLGDVVGFWIGHRLGREFLERHGARFGITRGRLEFFDRWFERRGGTTIVLGRFVGIGRALVPFICGASRIAFRRYIPYAVLGGALWSLTMCLLGYVFSRSFSTIVDLVGRASLAFGAVVVAVIAGVYAFRRLRHREQRERLARRIEREASRPALRPLAAVVRPLWRSVLAPAVRFAGPRLRFLGRRLTPGGLGLELTTALAIFVVAAYVVVLYAVVLAEDPGLTPLDQQLLDLSMTLETQPVAWVAKAVTVLGAFPVVAGAALATAIVLAARGHWIELTALLAGLAAVYAGVHLAKAGIDRPRPPDRLTGAAGSAWPSGHAAYATAYIAIGVIAASVSRGVARQAVPIAVGVGLAAAVGLTRIYLRVHYWSDVAGGWALGITVFSLAAAVALVVGHMRQNGRSPSAGKAREASASGTAAARGASP